LEAVSNSASYGSARQPTEGRASEGCRAEARRAKAGPPPQISSPPHCVISQAAVLGHSQRTGNLHPAV